MKRTIAEQIAHKLAALRNCQNGAVLNEEWERRHSDDIADIIKEGPSGSGWDCGTSFDEDRSEPNKLIFFGSFHHMDEHGGYDGWTDHVITVRPDFVHKLDIKISGRDRNGIKDLIHDWFHLWLTSTHEEKVDAVNS